MSFDVSLMRPAQQGVFDVAVTFNGSAFNEDGHLAASARLLSVGIC